VYKFISKISNKATHTFYFIDFQMLSALIIDPRQPHSIDSFEFLYQSLAKEITSIYGPVRDGLALLAGCYILKKVLPLPYYLYITLNGTSISINNRSSSTFIISRNVFSSPIDSCSATINSIYLSNTSIIFTLFLYKL
jgi:hypothetical protein